MSGLFGPIASLEEINSAELNDALTAWGHKMGPLRRPEQYGFWAHGLRHEGKLVAVTAASTLIRATCAGIPRSDAVELSRVCATRPDLCRAIVRLWREFVFPALCQARGYTWAVSYQDAVQHRGDLYRFDGWVPLATSSSGTDPRGGVTKSRRKVIWGWHPDAATRLAARNPKLMEAA